jgi:HK97 family phage major capsid protein
MPEYDPQAEVRKTRIVELRTQMDALDTQIVSLANKDVLTEDEENAWRDLNAERDVIATEYRKLEERAVRVQEIQKQTYREIYGLPEVRKGVEEFWGKDVRTLDEKAARDAALRILDDKDQSSNLNTRQLDEMEKSIRRNTDTARRTIVTETPHYRSAWHKLMRDAQPIFTGEETEALLRYNEYRAQSEGSTTGGGYAIPVFIDPSVILTDQEADNPFMRLCRVIDVPTNAWKGVSAAGVTWSFDAEAAAVSDDSITLAQPSISVNSARGFIPYSIEVGQDWPGFQAEMGTLLAAGYDDLLLSKFTNGSGTNEPTGILTALTAQTSTETTVTTDGAFGDPDLYKVWKALGQKYRGRASWMMSVGVMNKIRQFGTANLFHAATVTLAAGAVEVLFSKQVYENSYMPDFTGTTSTASILVVGDFSNYVIPRRAGMSIELVPHLFDVTNNRPTGQRGWFAHARIGGGVSNLSGFQVLCNT